MRIPLSAASWVDLDEAWVPPREADELLATLREELRWEQREIVLFGRRVLQPRLIAWAGTQPYAYSGQTLEPRAFTPAVQRLLDRLNQHAAISTHSELHRHVPAFDHVLVNRYRDGRDSMGLHADDEPELGSDPLVATLSFGASRRFVLVPRHARDGERRTFTLTAGSLLTMAGACQRQFRHGIPRARPARSVNASA